MINVMFMQSQSFFGADSEIHAQLLRYMDRSQVALSVAVTQALRETPEISARLFFEKIPGVLVRPTDFGRSREEMRGAGVYALNMVRAFRGLMGLAGFIRAHKIQIIHGTEKPRDAFYGTLLAKLTGARSVVHMHVSYGDWLSSNVKWALRNADAIIAVSSFAARSIVNAGYPAAKVHTVLNSLDLDSQRWNSRSTAREVRVGLGIPEKAVVLGVVSRLFLYKGHRDLLKALARVKNQMPEYRLVIVGEDAPRSHPGGGSFTEELKAQAAKLGISQNIIFTGFRTDIPQLMESFDLYTMPSWEEPFGMVYIEAMALGKPVVAWRQAGPEEIVVNGETGFLPAPKDIDALGTSILKLARSPALCKQFGKAGRRRVEEHFYSKRMCADVVEVYRSLVENP